MAETTPNLNMPYILPSQAQKHVTHNEAIRALDALVQLSIVARDVTTPPSSPLEGDRHIVAPSATGDWAGKDNEVAAFQDGAWLFYPPLAGWRAYDVSQAELAIFDGAGWVPLGGGGGGVSDGDKGDITVSGSGASWTIDAGAVTNQKLAAMATGSLKGRVASGSGAPEDLTAEQAKTLLALTAADIANTPAGGIVAATVQAALDELDSDKLSSAGGTVSGNLTVGGNLTVNGATYQVNATAVTYDDIILTVGGDTAPVADDAKDRGIAFRWHNGTAARLGFFGWDRSAQEFVVIPDATDTADTMSGPIGTVRANLHAEFVGVNASADTTNKLAVNSSAILFNHIGAGVQVKVNKAAAADSGSFLFQTGFSARAEIGLTGDDDFHFKVSADGSAFFESLWIAASNGLVTVKNGFRLDPAATDPVSPADGQLWYNSTLGKFRKREGGATSDLDGTGGGGGSAWGSITGTLSNQADLQGALDGKQPALVSGASIKTVNGNSLLGAGDLAISGGAAALGLHDFWQEQICTHTTVSMGPFLGAAISSGTNNTAVPAAAMFGYNPFGVFLRSSTTANSGYRYNTTIVNDTFGVQSHKFRCRMQPRTAHTNVTIRLGYLDTSTSADATDGAYFEIVAGTCAAKTANNAVRTTQGSLALTINTVYTFDVEVNAAGTSARFRIFEGANETAVFDQTITTNIPVTSARAFGCGIVATNSTTTASDICILYALGFGTVEGFARARG